MGESIPSSDPGIQKRRSTRIVQAVPLTVTGVDALGQPFKERTSTVIISCHGCKYQSKHYVPKNSYITLEIPNPEAGQPPRSIQARVTWVQRPRTVRELFQVGAELQVPGNVWGVAFPPEDWFPYLETGAEAPATSVVPEPAEPVAVEAGPPTVEPPAAAEKPAAPPPLAAAPTTPLPHPPEEKARVVPFPAAGEISALLARQMAKLLIEAKQQLQSAARDAAVAEASAETRRLLGQIDVQLRAAVEKAVDAAAASQVDQVVQRVLAQIDKAREGSTAALKEEWAHEAQRGVQSWTQHLTHQLAETAETFRAKLEKQIEAQLAEGLQRVQALHTKSGLVTETGRSQFEQFREEFSLVVAAARDQWQRELTAELERAQASLSEFTEARRKLNEEISGTTQRARDAWHRQMQADLATVNQQWEERIQGSLAGATTQLTQQLEHATRSAVSHAEQEMATRGASIRELAETLLSESRENLTTLRRDLKLDLDRAQTALASVQEAAKRAGESAARLERASETATAEVTRRFEAMVAAQSEELNRHAERAVSGIIARLQPSLDAAGQAALGNFRAQAEQSLAPLMGRAEETNRRLEVGRQEVEKLLNSLHDRLNRTADQIFGEAAARMQETVGQLKKDFEQTGQAALAQVREELDAKSTETIHTTFESLFKSSEWYQKKAQTSMQAAMEKAVDQAHTNLREQAAETSRLFASELEHYSRSYVEHTKGLLDETVKEVVQQGRGQLSEASQTTAASFTDEVHRIATRAAEDFAQASRRTLEETTAQMGAHAGQARAELEAQAKQAVTNLTKLLAEQGQHELAQTRQALEAQLIGLVKDWRARYNVQEQEWLDKLARVTSETVEKYKGRLENVSNSWLVASVTTLNQHSQTVLDTLAQAAETRLRQTCSQVFAGLAENLQARLLGISTDLQSDTPPATKK